MTGRNGTSAGRVDHVVFIVERKNLGHAINQYVAVLGVEFEGPFEHPSLPIMVAMSWSSGLEIIAPTDQTSSYSQWLADHGEGFYTIALGVGDLDRAVARASRNGLAAVGTFNAFDLNPAWRDRFDRIDEVALEPMHGVRFLLADVRPLARSLA